jgi:CRISPR/Cas system-associated protein Cas10 (large subunit of type III CRISPR-Cas system)
VQKSFDDARKAIKGNQSFIVSARKLVEMGAKENPRRPLPDISPDDDSQA